MRGKVVKHVPEALTTYEICAKFKKLPSEVYAEDAKDIEEMIIIMNVINQEEEKKDRKSSRDELKKKNPGASARR